MKKETREYLTGQRNATMDEFMMSREVVGQVEYISVSLPDSEEPILTVWRSRKKKGESEEPVGEIVKVRPKHTGGKRPYIMLMQDQRDTINSLSIDAAGLIMKLLAGGFIAWNTGQIIDRRTKKALTAENISTRFTIGKNKLKAILKELTEYKIIKYDPSKRSYFFNARFARKGGGKNAD